MPQVITDPCTTLLGLTLRLFKAFSLAFSSSRKWRLSSLISQHPKSFQPVAIRMQRENINHWETGSQNSSTFVPLSCCQVRGQSCSVPLAGGNSPALKLHFKEPPSTLERKTLPEPELRGKHKHPSSHPCTEQSLQQGLRADFHPRAAHSAHPTRSQRQGCCPTSTYSPPQLLSGSVSAFSQELLFLICQQSRPASEGSFRAMAVGVKCSNLCN